MEIPLLECISETFQNKLSCKKWKIPQDWYFHEENTFHNQILQQNLLYKQPEKNAKKIVHGFIAGHLP